MNEVIINLSGTIDSYGWFRSQIQYYLDKNKSNTVRFRLDSYGGSVNEALAISRLIEEHGNVCIEFMGYVASAATWMAFGAKSVETHEDTLWLCHKCSVPVYEYGYKNADDLDSLIQDLTNQKKSAEVIDLTIAKKYMDRCKKKGKSLENVLLLMKEERYITAQDCLEWGFVDRVIPGINKVENRNSVANLVNAMNLPPIPEGYIARNDLIPAGENNLGELLNNWGEKIISLFNKKEKNNNNEQVIEENDTTQTQNRLNMNEQFKTVNQLLNVTGLTQNKEHILLTVEQLTTLENSLAAIANAERALDAISDHVKNISGIDNKVNALKLVLDRIPTGIPANSIPGDGSQGDQTPDTVNMNDPVNEYAKGMKRKK